ncbi:hypothetical protein N7466_002293 [Penicillium verhagenii]|uniref:uncharacterized protein n=1 Tax=Penicillium verhagenii TaxID=1562060 RepID=UPI002545572C|nr:uncharacterized protein N7466_002293 [Penicillium verhagenii]KAJ5939159.1 hypothetical protein N7466_002293 [Penicillium verhagenii]
MSSPKTAKTADVRDFVFKDESPRRIVIKVHSKDLGMTEGAPGRWALRDVTDLVNAIFPGWETDYRISLLALDVRSIYSFVIIDVNNHGQDILMVHRFHAVIPVYVMRPYGSWGTWKLIGMPTEDKHVADELESLYRANGYMVKPSHDNYGPRRFAAELRSRDGIVVFEETF